jgi:hypothetical protein
MRKCMKKLRITNRNNFLCQISSVSYRSFPVKIRDKYRKIFCRLRLLFLTYLASQTHSRGNLFLKYQCHSIDRDTFFPSDKP